MRRAVLSVVLLAIGLTVGVLVSGCSGDEAPSTAPRSTLGDPVPPLPADILPAAFEPGQRGALGNLKVTLRLDDSSTDAATVVDLDVENGSLEPVVIDGSWFRLYLTDGSSVVATTTTGALVGQPLPSAEVMTLTVTFDHDPALEPLMLLVDGTRDDRINSGGFLLEASTSPVTTTGE